MIRETLEALKELEAKATAGPWWVERCKQHNLPIIKYKWDDVPTWIAEASDRKNNDADFSFIAFARNNLPQLLRIAEAAMELMQNEDVKRDMQDTAIFDKLAAAIGGDDAR